jgi:hypothetical protein
LQEHSGNQSHFPITTNNMFSSVVGLLLKVVCTGGLAQRERTQEGF